MVGSILIEDLLEISDLKSVPSLVDGNFVFSDKSLDKFNPISGKIEYKVCHISKKEYEKVISSLKNSSSIIEKSSFFERSEIILRASKLIEENIDILSKISASDSGKTIEESRGEIYGAIKIANYFGTEWMRSQGEILESSLKEKKYKNCKTPPRYSRIDYCVQRSLAKYSLESFPSNILR